MERCVASRAHGTSSLGLCQAIQKGKALRDDDARFCPEVFSIKEGPQTFFVCCFKYLFWEEFVLAVQTILSPCSF